MICPLCGSGQTALKYQIERFSPPFSVFECGQCLFQFQDSSALNAHQFYDEAYYTGGKEFTYWDERAQEKAARAVWKARVKKLSRADRSEGQKVFLDVGCSFGGLLQVAVEAGYQPLGVEVSEYSARYAAERFGSDRIIQGGLETALLKDNSCSVITMIEVIEHLADPATVLKKLHSALRPGGVLLVQTADMSAWQALKGGSGYHYYLPGHLSYFTEHNLSQALKNAGFGCAKVYAGVEFGLLPKLVKSRSTFQKPIDYLKWLRIASYHLTSPLKYAGRRMTSSMVVYAWKDK